jgi:nucleosome assembly protein 1-like 1
MNTLHQGICLQIVAADLYYDSFFEFFDTLELEEERKHNEELAKGIDDQELGFEDEDFAWATDLDFQVGEAFKNTLIPHALFWFTGEAKLDEYDHGDEEDEADKMDTLDSYDGDSDGTRDE